MCQVNPGSRGVVGGWPTPPRFHGLRLQSQSPAPVTLSLNRENGGSPAFKGFPSRYLIPSNRFNVELYAYSGFLGDFDVAVFNFEVWLHKVVLPEEVQVVGG